MLKLKADIKYENPAITDEFREAHQEESSRVCSRSQTASTCVVLYNYVEGLALMYAALLLALQCELFLGDKAGALRQKLFDKYSDYRSFHSFL